MVIRRRLASFLVELVTLRHEKATTLRAHLFPGLNRLCDLALMLILRWVLLGLSISDAESSFTYSPVWRFDHALVAVADGQVSARTRLSHLVDLSPHDAVLLP